MVLHWRRLVGLLCCTVSMLSAVTTANSTVCERPPPDQLIPADYDRRVAPFPGDQALPVHLSVWVVAVTSVSELQSDFSVALYLRLKWRDPRIVFPTCLRRPFLLIETGEIDRLWLPDVYFVDDKKSSRHMVVRRNAALRLNRENSTLYFSERLTLTLRCSFDFELFPMDTQVCEMIMEPYAYDKQFMDLRFENPGIYFNNFKARIAQFQLLRVLPGNCSYTYLYQGTQLRQSCLRAVFFFQRAFNYYLLQMYVPLMLIVAISFLGFWVPVNLVPGRIALSITTLLTLATQSQTVQRQLPPVSYMKASDVWMFACILAVFATLVEFTLSYRHYDRRLVSEQSAVLPLGQPRREQRSLHGGSSVRRRLTLASRSPHFVDNVSKILFPVLFVLFNIIYWLYFTASQKKKHLEKMKYIA
ncbi:Glycine receptor subunit alphaZ1 [Amphibalanus amphitrite]|uniref:Glycine receptor subunit alphaZ1 n=1 Tax=Amphibalanus amphitrite TaxID=1232801 RepID=A0A6A4W6L6_AMPAM|nr:Glycine receptor subunit alphaZ1 [Amphibalanus amphitrite]